MITAQETAVALAVLLHRSGQQRARISGKTIKMLAKRKHLRSAFIDDVSELLAEYSWTLTELDSGGYAAIRTRTLEAAKPVTAKRLFTDEERTNLRRENSRIRQKFEKEIAQEKEQNADEEDA